MNTTEKVKALLARTKETGGYFEGVTNGILREQIIQSFPEIAQSYLELQKELERKTKALEEIEWQSHDHFCYVCTAEKCKGHFPDCPIGKALSPDTND